GSLRDGDGTEAGRRADEPEVVEEASWIVHPRRAGELSGRGQVLGHRGQERVGLRTLRCLGTIGDERRELGVINEVGLVKELADDEQRRRTGRDQLRRPCGRQVAAPRRGSRRLVLSHKAAIADGIEQGHVSNVPSSGLVAAVSTPETSYGRTQ